MQRRFDRQKGFLAGAIVAVAFLFLAGCNTTPLVKTTSCPTDPDPAPHAGDNSRLAFPERLDQGYTVVLPGIWGVQPVEYGIVEGLKDSNTPSAIELYDWTAGAGRLVYNLRSLEHNQAEAQKIAARIIAYQDRYPGRPVHVVGYSGGAGVAVLTLEALPPDRRVTDAVLLAPTLASDYNLRPAINHTERGIRNFYSPLDVPILMVLCTAVGTTDGRHTLAAGAIGFEPPLGTQPEERRDYEARVSQQSYDLAMIMDGHGGGHFGWANRTFVARHIAPLLGAPTAPPPPGESAPMMAGRTDQPTVR
jgi:pimeloyl-ACP methyl ester carboxylesterase